MSEARTDGRREPAPEARFLVDPYLEWAQRQNIPIVRGYGADLLSVEVRPWARVGALGAFVHLDGRGDFIDLQVLELPPAGETTPQQHLAELVAYVLEGHGSTQIDLADGARHSFEWGPKSLFALPLNVRYRHFNGSGSRRARLAVVTNLPLVLNAFHNEQFVFDSPHQFGERLGEERYFRGEGTFIPMRPGRHMWETNFVPDLEGFELRQWVQRGAGGSNIMFVLADGTMHAHMSEMPVGTYKKGHRHGADFHVFAVTGHGYSLYWYEGERDFQRFDWRHGAVFAPAERQFHQHFNTSGEPSRYLALAYGGLRYPFSADKRATYLGMDVSVKEGGRQIEYEDEDPRILRIFEDELAKQGVTSRMREFHASLQRAG
jgi:hypothetical protein